MTFKTVIFPLFQIICVEVSMPSTQVAVEKRKISSIIEFFALPQLTVNDTLKV